MVSAHGADIGIALDGDADRLMIADEYGKIVDGDHILGLIAKDWAGSGRLNGDGVVSTVMSNLGLENYLKGIGLELIRTQVGDRYVVEYMRQNGFNLGGEQSGHIVLSDFSTTGDGLIAALQVLAVIVAADKPASQVCRAFDPLPQVLKSVKLKGKGALQNKAVMDAIAEGEERLGSGRLLIRPSGTEAMVRVMAEGEDEALVESVVSDIVSVIEKS
jgi:phosphoglucosamine mutase